MDYRDCFPRFPSSLGELDGLLAELHEAQNALSITEHYVMHWCAYPPTEKTLFSARHSRAAYEALREACNIIDRIVEILRIEAARNAAARGTGGAE